MTEASRRSPSPLRWKRGTSQPATAQTWADEGRSRLKAGESIETDEYQYVSCQRGSHWKRSAVTVKMGGVQASCQGMHLSASTGWTFLLRFLSPKITNRAAEDSGALSKWALASTVMVGVGAVMVGLAISEDVVSVGEVRKRQK